MGRRKEGEKAKNPSRPLKSPRFPFPSVERRSEPHPDHLRRSRGRRRPARTVATMDVFLMIRRKKTTMFLDAKENTTVGELKKMIEGITKQPPNQQRLYNHDDTLMDDDKTLADYGMTSTVAKAQTPSEVGLALMVAGRNSRRPPTRPRPSCPTL